jgi:hypothetical protein
MFPLSGLIRRRALRAVLALLLLGAQIAAVAHEFDHALGLHGSACALHAFADQAGKALTGVAPALALDHSSPVATASVAISAGIVSLPPFQGRAPPAFSHR